MNNSLNYKNDKEYFNLYRKYKNKYLKLKEFIGGATEVPLEDEDVDEWQILSNSSGSPERKITITELCCGRQVTQFPNRMIHCEGLKHTMAGYGATVVQRTKPFVNRFGSRSADSLVDMTSPSSLDGIVKIENNEIVTKIGSEDISVINKLNFVSDHDGILNNITLNDGNNFNLISFNLEGLCRAGIDDTIGRQTNEFVRRLELLELHLYRYNQPGNIIICQELVLQIYKLELYTQQQFINDSMREIQRKLRTILTTNNITGLNDGYTGGIFFDIDIWSINNIIEISRVNSEERTPTNKFSNAYLFKHNISDFQFWVVNIHLKASVKSQEEHIFEVRNIIEHLRHQNPDFTIPVYLCGDYNNKDSKKGLVEIAYDRIPEY